MHDNYGDNRGRVCLGDSLGDRGGGKILSISQDPIYSKITVCDMVYSRGRPFGPREGTVGYVVRINRPYQNNATSDVIEVAWDGHETSMSMKLEELRLWPDDTNTFSSAKVQ